jgi:hypothetical protein
VRIWHGPTTVTGEQTRKGHCESGKAGGAKDPGVRTLIRRLCNLSEARTPSRRFDGEAYFP